MQSRGQPTRILLVEDDPEDSLLIRTMLKEMPDPDWTLHWVSDAGEAVEEILHGPFDVCLLDYRLGHCTGLDLLREAVARKCHIPIILLTGCGDSRVDHEALKAGASDYLSKHDLSAALLERSIRYSIEHKRINEALEERVRSRTAQLFEANAALRGSELFARSTLDALSAHIAILDARGRIIYTNASWDAFGRANGFAGESFLGVNYLATCENVEGEHAEEARAAAAGIRDAIAGRCEEFAVEYPCPCPDAMRWFCLRITRFKDFKPPTIVVAHEDITERKQAEDALRSSLEEKVVLLREVHHRVKNNLQIVASLLGLQASRSQSGQVVDVLKDTRNRVHSMALLHETLYRSANLAYVNCAAYIADLCGQLQCSLGPVAVRIQLVQRVAPIRMPLELAVPCGLIVNELVSNAFKHAFPAGRAGRITVELDAVEGEGVVLAVRDDGVGLPVDIEPERTHTLGLQLVFNLARQLDGFVAVERQAGSGAAFRVVFPAAEAMHFEGR